MTTSDEMDPKEPIEPIEPMMNPKKYNATEESIRRQRGSTESPMDVEDRMTTNDAEDFDQEIDINANVTPVVVDAYLPDQESTPVLAAKETFFDQLRINGVKYSSVIFSALTIAAIIQIILFSCGIYRENDGVKRREYLQSLAIEVSGKDAFKVNESPQSIALRWMQEQDQFIKPFDQKSAIIQRYVAVVFYFSLGGPYWYHNVTFLNGTIHECDWNEWDVLNDPVIKEAHFSKGFHCRNNETLSDLIFYQMNLTGSIPTEIGLLSDVISINTGYNFKIRGAIPSEIGLLKDLESLFLYDNDLSGTIPNEIQNAASLGVISIFGNNDLSDNLDPICALNPNFVQTDCGNGTSKLVCDCCNICCNTDIRKCCFEGTTSCFSIDIDDEFVFD